MPCDAIRFTEYDIQDSRREPGIDQRLRESQAGRGRFFGWLYDTAASRRDGRAKLPHGRGRREIPRRERRDRTNGLLDHRPPTPRTSRNQPAIRTTALLPNPIQKIGIGQNLRQRLRQGLALLDRQESCDRSGPVPHVPGRFMQDASPLRGIDVAPDAKSAVGGTQRGIEFADPS